MLAVGVSYYSLFVDGPFPVFFCGSLIVILLAFSQADLAFDQVAFPVEFGGYTGVAFFLGGGVDFCQLSFVEQR